jgi:probable F420-dependent oxidoreductase
MDCHEEGSAVKFSVSIPVLRDPGASDPFRETFELARIAEESGFDTVTVGHHHFLPGNLSDPLTFLAAVAVRTSTVRVGTGIFQLPIHNPVRVAEQVATIDQLSAGRISLGVGSGWWPLEYDVHGSDFRQRGARMEEALQILRLTWEHEHATWDGRFYRFSDLTVYPRPVQQPHPPLWVAGVADAAIDRAARLGDGWLCGPVQSISRAKSCLEAYNRSCAEHGTEPSWILRRFAWVEADRRHVVDDVLPVYVNGLLAHWRESVEDDEEKALFSRMDSGEQVSAEEIARDRLLWGAPDDVIDQVKRYQAETGCTHVHAAFGSGLPGSSEQSTLGGFEDQARMMRLFGREVIPAFGPAARA